MLFPTVSWPTTSALAANLAYLYILPLYTFFSSLYHNVVIQSTSLQHCDIRILNFNFISILNAGMQGLKELVQFLIIYKIAFKFINIISSFITFFQFLITEVVGRVLIRVNISLIGSYIIRGPEFININSHFLILPLRIIKNKLYIVELRILQIRKIAFILRKI